MRAVDLFAGPGGWDEGIAPLGIRPLGIEWDDAACATRAAAGHETLQADVAELNPAHYFATDLLIASPPCQAFSVAGDGKGREDIALIDQCARNLTIGIDVRETMRAKLKDERALLVVEPLRWALAIRPKWIALEQVPTVLPFWRYCARVLDGLGYSTWTGVLSAERYGVPQTRSRAILLASRVDSVSPPPPTHQEYVPGVPAAEQHTLEGTLLPWVSMAEALGWGMTARPSLSVPSSMHGAYLEGGSGSRNTIGRERARGAWRLKMPGGSGFGTTRALDEPAQTLSFGKGPNDAKWLSDDPLGLKAPDWFMRRPATTIAGDSRVFQPGNHRPDVPGEQSHNAIVVTPAEASVLQSFRPDYPWQGNQTQVFQQIGNAVPPLLGRAVISALVGAALEERAA